MNSILRSMTGSRKGHFTIAGLALIGSILSAQTPMEVYGLWHCYSDACSWASA